jgi:hypothetical protein
MHRFSVYRKAQPNNSFNPTALSLPFMMLVSCDWPCVISSGGGLIRALGTPERNDMRHGIENNAELHAVAKRRPNFSLNRSAD